MAAGAATGVGSAAGAGAAGAAALGLTGVDFRVTEGAALTFLDAARASNLAYEHAQIIIIIR